MTGLSAADRDVVGTFVAEPVHNPTHARTIETLLFPDSAGATRDPKEVITSALRESGAKREFKSYEDFAANSKSGDSIFKHLLDYERFLVSLMVRQGWALQRIPLEVLYTHQNRPARLVPWPHAHAHTP